MLMRAITFFLFAVIMLVSCEVEQKKVVMDNKENSGIKIDKTIGIGRLQVSLNKTIPLYRTVEDTVPFDSLLFSRHESGEDKGSFLVTGTSQKVMNPMKFYRGDTDSEAKDNIIVGLYILRHSWFLE